MNAIRFPEVNINYVADGCHDLPAYHGDDTGGQPVIISCWQPTPEELEEINRTGKVWLFIVGTSQPPVSVTGHHPFVASVTNN